MSVLCGKCHNHHDTVDDVKVCYGLLRREPVVPYRQHPPFVPSTPRQREYVKDLGGDVMHASSLSKESCSKYIDELKRRGARVSSPSYTPEPKNDPKFDMFQNLFATLPDGRYAIRRDETEAYTFFRIKSHTKGRLANCRTIQTQHSENLKRVATQYSNGRWYFERGRDWVVDLMLLVCLDHKTAAFNYGQELGSCNICGRELTDERSRFYSIGPDCEQRHQSFIDFVEDIKGMSYEQARAQLLV